MVKIPPTTPSVARPKWPKNTTVLSLMFSFESSERSYLLKFVQYSFFQFDLMSGTQSKSKVVIIQ